MTADGLALDSFETATLAFLAYLAGAHITRQVAFLRNFNIPEPVTGGLIAAFAVLGFQLAGGPAVTFDLALRDYLLVVFFAGIGLNARLGDLARGGRPLLILVILTVALILAQNIGGTLTAVVFGLPAASGVLLGSASLTGGHGTTIAWAPEIAAATGRAGLMELGIASATLGLIVAALIGGPLAKALITRHRIAPPDPGEEQSVGLGWADEARAGITPVTLVHALFVLHLVIVAGMAVHGAILWAGLKLPLFVPCMLVAILAANLYPVLLPRAPRIARSPTLALVTDFALGVFLAMSLMAMNLAALADIGAVVAASLMVQTALALVFIAALVFPLMGRGHEAAVLSAGFAGFALGATPTAIANMTAVTKRHGPAPVAFVILPLVSAFFVDLANATIIQGFLAVLGP
ncbi:MAG: sodium/glutamate symporter [Gemmobacter sp.]